MDRLARTSDPSENVFYPALEQQSLKTGWLGAGDATLSLSFGNQLS